MGDVVLLELLKSRKLLPSLAPSIDLFFLVEDETLRRASLEQIQKIREAGFSVDYFLSSGKSDKQFKKAVDSGARMTARLEQSNGGVSIRCKDLQNRAEECLSPDQLIAFLETRLRTDSKASRA